MKTRKLLLLAATLLISANYVFAETGRSQKANINAPVSGFINQTQQFATPDALLRDLYKVHAQGKIYIISLESRGLINKYFDKNLARLILKDLTDHQNDIGVIDMDIFYNTQDPEVKKTVVGQPKISGDKATVTAVNVWRDGRKEPIVYSLIKQNGSWKISDIKYQHGNTLLKYFREGV